MRGLKPQIAILKRAIEVYSKTFQATVSYGRCTRETPSARKRKRRRVIKRKNDSIVFFDKL
jgi:hypothetical protein